MSEKISPRHLERSAIVYVRQSSPHQVLHNEESRRLQYAMKQRVLSLGWRNVEVIDEDLGLSAVTTVDRTGFQRMVAEVCLGKVGAIVAREVSRFARNNRDWHQLIEMCSLVDTLLIDQEAVYNPRQSNDRLLLGLKGSLSEYELDLLRQRSLEARWAKARRGELVITAPIGFLKTSDQKLELDPDQRVQQAIRLVFEKFLELGSARQALVWFLEKGLQIPTRRYGAAGWETVWRRTSYRSVIRILKDPTYAGAYSFGRTGVVSSVKDGVLEKKRARRPMTEWGVLIRDHHDGYIAWELFEVIQTMLSKNVSSFGSPVHGAAKRGVALLGGLLRCHRCGRKLLVNYTGKNHLVPRYCCLRGRLDTGEQRCISFGGLRVDEAVSAELIRVLEPAAIEAARATASDATRKQSDVVDALMVELKAARYAAERSWKQYDSTDPENRLVADQLERRWNAALQRVGEIEARIDVEKHEQRRHKPLSTDSLANLTSDLDAVWNDPEADVRLKKRILRTLIEEIVVDLSPESTKVELVIHWKGGIHSSLQVVRRVRGQNSTHAAMETVDAVCALSRICKDDTIASYLNRNGIPTGRGNRWTRERVTSLRSHRRIPNHDRNQRESEGWMNLGEAAVHVGVAAKTLRLAAERGEIKALHPLKYGPWIFLRADLDVAITEGRFRGGVAGHSSAQLALGISGT